MKIKQLVNYVDEERFDELKAEDEFTMLAFVERNNRWKEYVCHVKTQNLKDYDTFSMQMAILLCRHISKHNKGDLSGIYIAKAHTGRLSKDEIKVK